MAGGLSRGHESEKSQKVLKTFCALWVPHSIFKPLSQAYHRRRERGSFFVLLDEE